ncbi:MAG: MazG nucleotide pyrophosphohydrolase domain-containing protein [Elusimicrobiota bacterium]
MWDKKQTYKSLIPHLEEETQEVKEAALKNDIANLEEELGDLLYLIIFYSQIAKEKKDFSINTVLSAIQEKIIRRHPHVFSDVQVSSIAQIKENWEKIKKKEKNSSAEK